jgi:hypothetical protein
MSFCCYFSLSLSLSTKKLKLSPVNFRESACCVIVPRSLPEDPVSLFHSEGLTYTHTHTTTTDIIHDGIVLHHAREKESGEKKYTPKREAQQKRKGEKKRFIIRLDGIKKFWG